MHGTPRGDDSWLDFGVMNRKTTIQFFVIASVLVLIAIGIPAFGKWFGHDTSHAGDESASLSSQATGMKDKIQEMTQEGIGNVRKQTGEYMESAGESAASGKEEAQETAESLRSRASKIAEDVYQQAESTGEKSQEAAGSMRQKAGEYAQTVRSGPSLMRSKLSETSEGLRQTLADIQESIEQTLVDWTPLMRLKKYLSKNKWEKIAASAEVAEYHLQGWRHMQKEGGGVEMIMETMTEDSVYCYNALVHRDCLRGRAAIKAQLERWQSLITKVHIAKFYDSFFADRAYSTSWVGAWETELKGKPCVGVVTGSTYVHLDENNNVRHVSDIVNPDEFYNFAYTCFESEDALHESLFSEQSTSIL